MSSDTPPSIPPRSPSGGDTGKQGATTPTSSAPAAKGTAPAKPAAGAARPAATPPSAPTRPTATGAAAAPVRTSATGASATPARSSAPGAGTATQEAVRPAPRATGPAPAPAPERAPSEASAKTAPRPAVGPIAASAGPRRVRLAISRIDPWSVMKLSFLVSVAIGIMIVVASAVVWLTLDSLEVFARLDGLITEILADSNFDIMKYVEFDRVISVSTLIAVVDVFLITALATIGAFLYNIVAALVGGVHVTMTDD